MKIRNALALSFLFLSSNVVAEPVYLQCVFSDDRTFNVTLNPEQNDATIQFERSGYLANIVQTIFKPDVVDIIEYRRERIFQIDRSTLVMKVTIPLINATEYGDCVMMETPSDRKF